MPPVIFGKRWITTACPRSGTVYGAAFFQSAGFDFYHERLGKHGGCGWQLILWDELSKVDAVFHQVRHPKDCLARVGGNWDARTWKIMAEATGGEATWKHPAPGIGRGVEFWVRWNEMCESKSLFTYRVEDLNPGTPVAKRISETLDLPTVVFGNIPKNANSTGNQTKVSYADAQRHCPEYAERALLMSQKYGYAWA